MIKEQILSRLKTALLNHVPDDVEFILERPKHADHGDYALPLAFQLAKTFRKPPKMIAEELCTFIESEDFLATPVNGFINISLTPHFFKSVLIDNIVEQQAIEPKKICLEYVSANPTGPLHIGHGRWAVIGNVMSRILKAAGHHVEDEFYINDAGNQVDNFYASVRAVKEGQPIPEDGYHGAYIQDLAEQDEDPLLVQLHQQKETLSRLGVVFDTWFSEKSLHQSGEVQEALETLSNLGWTYQQDGATWFKSSELGDEKDRVLIKADGKLTYFAVDIAYHYNKLERHYDHLVNIWGADHHGYVARVKASIKALKNSVNVEDSFTIIIGQLVNLLRDGEPVRMSKRTGDMITLDEVIEEIGVDATRYFLVSKSSDTHVEFDLELAKKKSAENPVYYIQYAHARMCTLLSKYDGDLESISSFQALEKEEHVLLKHVIQFQDTVDHAATTLSPYRMAQYAYDLAKFFHSFYEACPILKASEVERRQRLFIISIVKSTLVNSLDLLGITAPESM